MKKICLILMFLLALPVPAHAVKVVGKKVKYSSGDTTLKGYIAYDKDDEGRRPAVIVVHEWWGHNKYARDRAEKLAELGFVAFAIDMYGDGKTAKHPDEAGAFAGEAMKNAEQSRLRFLAAMDVLKEHELVKPNLIGAIGYCFGGSTVLNMARQGVDLVGVVSFHGGLTTSTPAKAGEVKAKVMVANGKADEMVTPKQIAAFKKEMEKAGVDLRFFEYEGAKHSFTNPGADKVAEEFGLPLAYNQAADEASWEHMDEFFTELFF